MQANRAISIITGVLVFFLAASAFVLSYDALHSLALANGITPGLAWLWPLTLDAVMIAASLTVLRNSSNGERAWYAWLLVGTFTLLSITFNTLHAPDTWLARAVFALPPAVVFLSFELLVSQVKSAIKRAGLTSTLDAMTHAVKAAQADLAELNRQADELSRQRETLQAEVAKLCAQCAKQQADSKPLAANDLPSEQLLELANQARQSQIEHRRNQILDLLRSTTGLTYGQLAQKIGVSEATVKRDVTELKGQGKVRRNGHGLELASGVGSLAQPDTDLVSQEVIQ